MKQSIRQSIITTRALWRYRGRIAAHGERYPIELATLVHTQLEQRAASKAALVTYRLSMRVMTVGIFVLAALALALYAGATAIVGPWWALIALAIAAVPVGFLLWYRLVWGRPLSWLDEYADKSRQIPLDEVPDRLRELAMELRDLANVPAAVSQEIDTLASQASTSGSAAVGMLPTQPPAVRHD